MLGDVEGVTKGVWELQPGDVGELGAGESGKDSLPQLGEIEGWVGQILHSLLMVYFGEKWDLEQGSVVLRKNQSQQEQSRTGLVLVSVPRFYLDQFWLLLHCAPGLVCSTGRGTTGSSEAPASWFSS